MGPATSLPKFHTEPTRTRDTGLSEYDRTDRGISKYSGLRELHRQLLIHTYCQWIKALGAEAQVSVPYPLLIMMSGKSWDTPACYHGSFHGMTR
jgi:hypothetical protein